MRGIDGPCGHFLEAKDDERLVRGSRATPQTSILR